MNVVLVEAHDGAMNQFVDHSHHLSLDFALLAVLYIAMYNVKYGIESRKMLHFRRSAKRSKIDWSRV